MWTTVPVVSFRDIGSPLASRICSVISDADSSTWTTCCESPISQMEQAINQQRYRGPLTRWTNRGAGCRFRRSFQGSRRPRAPPLVEPADAGGRKIPYRTSGRCFLAQSPIQPAAPICDRP